MEVIIPGPEVPSSSIEETLQISFELEVLLTSPTCR